MRPGEWKLELSLLRAADEELASTALIGRLLGAGIRCVETGMRWDGSARAEELKRTIGGFQDGGVEVWSVHTQFGENIDISNDEFAGRGIEVISSAMRVCAEMGVDKVIVHPSSEPIEDADRAGRVARCAESVKSMYRADVAMALETLPRSCLMNSPAETSEVLSRVGGVARCCVDVNHCQRGSAADTIRAAGDRLITLHISDDDGNDEKHWLPGEGVIDWREVFGALENAGYEGCFMYETRNKDPYVIRRNYDMLVENYYKGR